MGLFLVMIKLGGDKGGGGGGGGGVNEDAVTNTCVFVAYEASDSKTNLYLSLDAYKLMI